MFAQFMVGNDSLEVKPFYDNDLTLLYLILLNCVSTYLSRDTIYTIKYNNVKF
jgi:hypothetical protein